MSITMSYPYGSSASDTVTLRNPDHGNSEQIHYKTRFKITMSGLVHAYKTTPKLYKLLMRWNVLCDSIRADLKIFLTNSSGSEVEFIDWNSVTWRVFITNNPFELSKNNTEASSVVLEMVGTKV